MLREALGAPTAGEKGEKETEGVGTGKKTSGKSEPRTSASPSKSEPQTPAPAASADAQIKAAPTSPSASSPKAVGAENASGSSTSPKEGPSQQTAAKTEEQEQEVEGEPPTPVISIVRFGVQLKNLCDEPVEALVPFPVHSTLCASINMYNYIRIHTQTHAGTHSC